MIQWIWTMKWKTVSHSYYDEISITKSNLIYQINWPTIGYLFNESNIHFRRICKNVNLIWKHSFKRESFHYNLLMKSKIQSSDFCRLLEFGHISIENQSIWSIHELASILVCLKYTQQFIVSIFISKWKAHHYSRYERFSLNAVYYTFIFLVFFTLLVC